MRSIDSTIKMAAIEKRGLRMTREFWRKPSVIAGMAITISLLLASIPLVYRLIYGPRIIVSRETTYLTEPLRPNGYPDFCAAINRRLSEGVTPENNAAVLFWQAVGPRLIQESLRQEYFQRLGMTPPPETGDYFVDYDTFVQRDMPAGTADPNAYTEAATKELEQAIAQPWSAQEFPRLAKWLTANEKPLTLLVEASKRPRRYDPILSQTGRMFDVLLPGVQQQREITKALVARATQNVCTGNVDAAWGDLQACHRWARLAGQGFCIVEVLIGSKIDHMAFRGDLALLANSRLSANQATTMRQWLADLPRLPSMADIVDSGERLAWIDFVLHASQEGARNPRVFEFFDYKSGRVWFWTSLVCVSSNWESVLLAGNALFDQCTVACRKKLYRERKATLDTLDAGLRRTVRDPSFWNQLKSLCLRLIPAIATAQQAEDSWNMHSELIQLAFSLAAYRADHGAYPKKLAELAPKYIKEVPKDMFNNDADLHYQRQDGGYLL